MTRAPGDEARPIAPPTAEPPAVAKVAYYIASHVHPPQVARLVRACRSGGPWSRVIIHHDERVSHLDPATVLSLGNVQVLPWQTVGRGEFSECDMVLRAMQWFLDHCDCDWLVYLSGQDYPIQPLKRIEQSLCTAPVDAFVDAKPVEECSWIISGQRYLYRYYLPPRIRGVPRLMKWLRQRNERILASGKRPRLLVPWTRTGAGKIGVRPFLGPFHRGFCCYFGSAWWSLRRHAVERVVRFHREQPNVARHYRRTLYAPNESYFLTILLNDPTLRCVADDNKRFISWSQPQTSHPDLLGIADFDRLIASGAHFARKFDARVDARILDRLDETLFAAP